MNVEHPDIIVNYKNKYIKNMYLEKENYPLWKDLQHEELLERINSGMLDHVLLDESNKAYMKNLKPEEILGSQSSITFMAIIKSTGLNSCR